MFSRRIVAASPMMGIVMVMTWLTMFHGSHLNLKKISQAKTSRWPVTGVP